MTGQLFSQDHLNADELALLLARGDQDIDPATLQHLGTCESCRRRLEQVAAHDGFWQQSAEVLRAFDLGEDGLSGELDELDRVVTDHQDATALIVRSILSPSECPESLGRLSRFEILGIVGAGGMGIVLKARDVDIQRIVAIKIPAPHLWRSPTVLSTIEREARSAAAIVHPHVIAIYQVDRWRNVPFLVMPYFLGGSLDQHIANTNGPLPLEDTIRITRQLAEALAAAHEQGVIHRDVKPGNVLLHRSLGRAVLCDFGLAKVQHDATLTASGFFAGTPSYLSPEQARGEPLGPASDLYCLGSVLWTMLTGKIPWHGEHPHAITRKIADGQFPDRFPDSDRKVSDSIPSWVSLIERRLHAATPQERFGSANELVQQLKACEKHLAEPTRFSLPSELTVNTPRPQNARRRDRLPILTSMFFLVVMASYWLLQRSNRPIQSPAPVERPSRPTRVATPLAQPDAEFQNRAATLERMLDGSASEADQLIRELQLLQQTSAPETNR